MRHVDISVIVALFKINTIDNILKFIVDTRSNKFKAICLELFVNSK